MARVVRSREQLRGEGSVVWPAGCAAEGVNWRLDFVPPRGRFAEFVARCRAVLLATLAAAGPRVPPPRGPGGGGASRTDVRKYERHNRI